MTTMKKGTPAYKAWVLTPEYKEHCERFKLVSGGNPKKGTPAYESWVLTPEYEEFHRIVTEFFRKRNKETPPARGAKRPWISERNKSEEMRKKDSEGHMGEKNPMFGLTGEKNPNFGRCVSDETRKRQSEIRLEKIKLGVHCRENHPQWKGEDFPRKYPQKFNVAFKRQNRSDYGNVCFFPGCGITPEENGKNLDVHHYDYDKNSENCVPLCRRHNCAVNANRKEWEEYFETKVDFYWNCAKEAKV